ncbi:hypothetical protein [Actinomadura violacea]|uniref:hypothetical protein n=1 Tax=Actinomadura violacea TaxID=2819934 RepID=UPI001E43E0A4|nr:hypothetical protein [Actinomadura violacea]
MEVQQESSEAKRRQLPRYAASLWLMLDCPVTLLCICPDVTTAAFFAKPIPTDLPGYVAQVVVLGPDDVPAISDAAEVAPHPEVAVLSVLVHQERKVAEAFVRGLQLMPNEYAPQYYEYAYDMASRAARRTLEELMASSTWLVSSPFAREHFGRGKSEGRAEGEAEALLVMLDARGLQVPDSTREVIAGCTDTGMLEKWIRRAAVIDKVEDLFD